MTGGLGVLLVEDSVDDMFFQRVKLEKIAPDAQVTTCSYAEDALDYLGRDDRGPVDLIFLDMAMPRMTGFEFLDSYAGLPADRRTDQRIVMVSASIDPTDRDQALNHPLVSDFMRKPLSQDMLAAAVHRTQAGRKG